MNVYRIVTGLSGPSGLLKRTRPPTGTPAAAGPITARSDHYYTFWALSAVMPFSEEPGMIYVMFVVILTAIVLIAMAMMMFKVQARGKAYYAHPPAADQPRHATGEEQAGTTSGFPVHHP